MHNDDHDKNFNYFLTSGMLHMPTVVDESVEVRVIGAEWRHKRRDKRFRQVQAI